MFAARRPRLPPSLVAGETVVGELVQAWPEHEDPHDSAGAAPAIGGVLTSNPAFELAGSGFPVAGRGSDNGLWIYDARSGVPGWIALGGRLR